MLLYEMGPVFESIRVHFLLKNSTSSFWAFEIHGLIFVSFKTHCSVKNAL